VKAFETVYRLQDDVTRVEQLQRATLNTEEFGIEPTHGLFGSDEWWGRIESGELPVGTVTGKISRVYMASMGDWPQFEVTESDGSKSDWTREANTKELSALYVVGRAVEIDYVLQRHRPKSYDGGAEHKILIAVRVDASPAE